MNAARKIPEDWHPADVKAALEKKGYTMARVARELGLSPRAAHLVLSRSWSTMEGRVAEIIGVPPWEIWPSRYMTGVRMTAKRREARRRFPLRNRDAR